MVSCWLLRGYDGNDAAVGVLVDGVTSNIETADIQTQEARHYNADQGTIGAATIQATERPRDGGVGGQVVVAGRATRVSGVRGRGARGGRGDHSLGLQFATGDILGE
ncbi:unnamed protein product [Phytophthora fragariaefolia]|uniref:Unnamed protein product n=1 Tax=Phytophthora fragariaefolia TaxID=1490495 RepID=A0A9W6YAB9_9STRA|nr:unnamed protein product [Phytophthora fragariaefolia]